MKKKSIITSLINSGKQYDKKLYFTWLEIEGFELLVIADASYLYLLEFNSRVNIEKEILGIQEKLQVEIIEGRTPITDQIEKELNQYFSKELTEFQTPVHIQGTAFQKRVWQELLKIPYGETISYKELATRVGNANGFRAVANANGRNQLAIIIPCHRVINHNGKLGGYGGGLDKKIWLLEHEKEC